MSLHDHILGYLTKAAAKTAQSQSDLYTLLLEADIPALEGVLTRLFASIAYNNFSGSELYHYEGYYASVIYSFFASLGTTLIAEDVTNLGRIDLTLRVPQMENGEWNMANELITYIFEFKVIDEETGDGQSALQQIKTKEYARKYDGEIWLIGIEFGKSVRNVVGFAYEKVGEACRSSD